MSDLQAWPLNRIALIVIARDEARCISRCLDSARPWVDEMWVLDTGSVDDTVQIARRSGAQVAHFVWQDDFAAARNAALALTDAQWRLVLDADEWLASAAPELDDLRRRSDSFIGLIRVQSQIDDARGRQHLSPSWLPRWLPQGVSYAGRIHEQPASSLRRERLGLQLLHDGYRREQVAGKLGRNRRLLQQALTEDPTDTYLRYQLGKDFEVQGDFGQAHIHYAQALPDCQAQASWRHDLVLRQLFTLKQLGQFEAAMQLAAAEMPLWGDSPDFYFTLGDLLLDWAASDPQRAGELLPMIEASWQRAIAIGERAELEGSVSGRGSWLAAHNLAVFHESLGHAALAREWRQREAVMLSQRDAMVPSQRDALVRESTPSVAASPTRGAGARLCASTARPGPRG